ncbi:outer membrane lipoprotein carrier protein LolA [Shewanella denitrificans OS217]|jgi:outer membrane lipoprotein carrier protein|uniref:Outer-membrane lipoprotein carrier protein n=1 Tax=Shewanella denitrificans (strain OS217 / ATCC BAA-1090 / DSM 15013) TaxID=318161 RepID=Q12NE8_SHEDO|nr:outer membrane lipoprotein chaperone LolA [Shewanella denitrificans]ABE55028.1 outer membrane lipoprotein carrier protein LolA [Shewanella denitrificans OS217]
MFKGFLSSLCVTALGASALLTSTACVADDAAKLRGKLAQVDSLHAAFSQQVTDINNKLIQQGQGVFALAYPSKFYWHLVEPDESLIVADGTDLWVYNPFAEEVTVMDVSQAVEASPIALLVHRDEETWSLYHVEQASATGDTSCFNILPKTLKANVVAVSVCFKGKQLTDFNLTDSQGNLSRFALSAQRQVKSDEIQLFKFALPENVDIDDQRLKQGN